MEGLGALTQSEMTMTTEQIDALILQTLGSGTKDNLRAMVRAAYELGKIAQAARPFCARYGQCVCGGDTPEVREGCANWKTPYVMSTTPQD